MTVTVQLDIETFEKIEEVLEDHGLYQLMQEPAGRDEEVLDLEQAGMMYDGRCFGGCEQGP